jgi:hypothetical protein
VNHPAAGATTLRKPLPAALLDALLGERVGASVEGHVLAVHGGMAGS